MRKQKRGEEKEDKTEEKMGVCANHNSEADKAAKRRITPLSPEVFSPIPTSEYCIKHKVD